MPKLDGIEKKFINGMSVDKEGVDVWYNDETHSYFSNKDGKRYISVTQLIDKYSNEFDEDFWTSYKALEAIMDLQDFLPVKKLLLAKKKFDEKLLDRLKIDKDAFNEEKQKLVEEYAIKRKEATDRGTKIHAQFERMFRGGGKLDLKQFGYLDMPEDDFHCEQTSCVITPGYAVYPEVLLSYTSDDGILRISGQSDFVLTNGNYVSVGDFKTNKQIDTKSYYNRNTKKFTMMKYPLDTVMDCNLGHYQVQLSIYAYMIEKSNPDMIIDDLRIVHIDHDGKQKEYKLDYLKTEVEKLFDHYRRELIKQDQLDRLKPVIV